LPIGQIIQLCDRNVYHKYKHLYNILIYLIVKKIALEKTATDIGLK